MSKLEATAEGTLTRLAATAVEEIGAGKGPTYGTAVHTGFANLIRGLKNSNLTAEVSYLNGNVVKRGTPGSIRVDAILGPVEAPTAVFDLKTGSAQLTPRARSADTIESASAC